MAWGNEVVFGALGAESVLALAKAVGFSTSPTLSLEDSADLEDFGYDLAAFLAEDASVQPLQRAIREAWRDALFEARIVREWLADPLVGHFPTGVLVDSFPGHADTRDFAPWMLEVGCDPGDTGDTAKTVTLGVALSSRYYPTYLDWRNPNGALLPLVLDDEFHRLVTIARRHVLRAIPALGQVRPQVSIRLQWY